MSKNEVYGPTEVHRLAFNVGAATFKAGDPVKVGNFVGVCELSSDGGYNAGIYTGLATQYGTSIPSSGLPVNWSTVALKGIWRLPVVTAAAAAVGDWVYIKPDNTLTTVSAGGTKFGILYGDTIAGAVVTPGANVQVYLLGFVIA